MWVDVADDVALELACCAMLSTCGNRAGLWSAKFAPAAIAT